MRPRTRWIGSALMLALMAVVPAGLSAWLNPLAPRFRMPELPQIGVPAARNLAGALWVDARPMAEYDEGHVPKAVSLPAGAWDEHIDRLLDVWQSGTPLVVYCSSKDCDAAEMVARRLVRELGETTRVFVLRGGWESWVAQ